MSRWLYFVDIEGVGDPSATSHPDGRTCFSWSKTFLDDSATQDPDGLFVSGMKLLKWPEELEFSFDPYRQADTWGSISLEFARDATALAHLWNDNPDVSARLTTAIDATTTTVILDTGALNATTIHLEREAIYLGSVSGAGPYTYTGCVRGALGTVAAPHAVGNNADVECFARMHPDTLGGRIVRLRRIPMGGTYADIETRFPGVLYEVKAAAGGARIGATVEHVVSILKKRKIYADPWRQNKQETTAGVGVPDAGYSGDYRAIIGSDEGAWIARYTADGGGGISFPGGQDYPPLAQGRTIPADGELSNVREVYSTHDTAPSNNASPSTNTLPLSQNPGVLALQLLLTTEGGENSASYDLGLKNLAGGIPAALVDVAALEAWGESVGDVMTTFHIGLDSADPVDLYALIQERILRPLGAALVQGQDGLLTVASFSDAAIYGASKTIGGSGTSIHNPTNLTQNRKIEDGVGRVVLKYNDRPGFGPDTIDSNNVLKNRRTFLGESERLEIDARGIGDVDLAMALTTSAVKRFAGPIIEYTLSALSGADHWPGDVVSVTGSGLLAGGERGLTNAVCQVTGRREQLDDSAHLIHFTLRYVGELYASVGFIAPSAVVASWDAGTTTITFEANTYTDSAGPALATDGAGFVDGDVVQLVDKYGTVRDVSATVTASTANTATVSGMGVTPAATDVLRVVTYANAADSQHDDWAWIADADGLLDGADPPNQYVTG